MVFSHAALCESIGSLVIGVFQMLSAGKTGHFVPGSIVPLALAVAAVVVEEALANGALPAERRPTHALTSATRRAKGSLRRAGPSPRAVIP
ncbi:MAG: hypothetical protein ACLQK4_00365 [Acidimicrobiales bacterium]|jgi:hypothetical protein